MENKQRHYIAIDLKSFYASVECVERGLDPLDTCLVVADSSRTDKTICLAVSPALKSYGIGGRPRLFEVIQRVRDVNYNRGKLGKSVSAKTLDTHTDYAVDYIVAPPRMALYLEYSARIYDIYLRYIAPEDIHIYSIDEVFIDVTSYMNIYKMSLHDLTMKIIRDVLSETGITATAGIGTNLYLCKIAMDIVAKKMPPDKDGVRVAELDEMSYRQKLWEHTPLTDFWRVGKGIAKKLAPYGIYTMGDIARCSINQEGLLYRLFGVNAELLIDHAWGWEPVTMDTIKSYKPKTHSVCSGQVLPTPYTVDKAKIVALEMADSLSLELVDDECVAESVTLEIKYEAAKGRKTAQHAHGTFRFERPTFLSDEFIVGVSEIFDRIVDKNLYIRRITLSANNLIPEIYVPLLSDGEQLNLFEDYSEIMQRDSVEKAKMKKELDRQKAVLKIKRQFGKNAILKGLNYSDGATQRMRNEQIGGHHE